MHILYLEEKEDDIAHMRQALTTQCLRSTQATCLPKLTTVSTIREAYRALRAHRLSQYDVVVLSGAVPCAPDNPAEKPTADMVRYLQLMSFSGLVVGYVSDVQTLKELRAAGCCAVFAKGELDAHALVSHLTRAPSAS